MRAREDNTTYFLGFGPTCGGGWRHFVVSGEVTMWEWMWS